jgi:ribose transport system substrate-binding protein
MDLPRRILIPLTLASVAFGLAGCSGTNSNNGSAGGDGTANGAATDGGADAATDDKIIGVSLMTLTNPFFKVIGDSITAEAAKHGYRVEVYSAEEDAAKQDNQVKEFIVKKCAAIVLAPYDSKAIATSIAAADAAGIPVFTVDNACLVEGAKVVSHVATDNYYGGKQAAEAMIAALGESGGKIAILDHKVTESCTLRVAGFKKVLDAHNAAAANKIEIVAELPSGGNRETGHRSTQDIIQANSDLKGIFAINDPSALGAYAALTEANMQDDVVIIGFDGQPQGKEAILQGKIYADPIQFPDQMGAMIVELIMKYFDGEKLEPEYLISTALYTKADAEKEFGAQAN